MNFNIKSPDYNDKNPMEIFYDFNGAHILRVNTTDSAVFLKSGQEFDSELSNRLDVAGRCKVIYIADKIPPLTSLLSFIESPFSQDIEWAAYAVIMPSDTTLISKFMPVLTYGINLTSLKGRYSIKIFEHKFKYNLSSIIKWLEAEIENNDGNPRMYLD